MTIRMKTMAALGVGLLAATGTTTAAAGAASSAHSLAVHAVKVPKLGTVLTTSTGLTLYRFTVDPAGQATCTGACAKVWPPLLLPKSDKKVAAPHGVKGLSVIHVTSGRLQVAFQGQALYRFAGDKKKGQTKGQGVENDWFAVLSNGKSSAPATAPTTSVAPATGTTGTTATTAPKSTPTTSPTSPPVTTTPPTSPPPPPTTTTTTAPVGGGAGF